MREQNAEPNYRPSKRAAPICYAANSDKQAQAITRGKTESCLDPRVPLGLPIAHFVEFGPTIHEYYRNKTRRGERGTYWGLHQTAPFTRR